MLDYGWFMHVAIQSHINLAGLTSNIVTFKDHAVVYIAGLTSTIGESWAHQQEE